MGNKSSIKEWPYGFLERFWEHPFLNYQGPPEDVDVKELTASVEYVLAVSDLSDYQIDLLHKRYQDRLTIPAIASEYHLHPTTVRDHIFKAILNLYGSQKSRIILAGGLTHYMRKKAKIEEDELFQERVREEVRKVRIEDYKFWARKFGTDPETIASMDKLSLLLNTPLSALPLPYRAHTRFQIAGFETAADIVSLPNNKPLFDLNGYGKGTHQKVLKVLEEHGFDVQHLE